MFVVGVGVFCRTLECEWSLWKYSRRLIGVRLTSTQTIGDWRRTDRHNPSDNKSHWQSTNISRRPQYRVERPAGSPLDWQKNAASARAASESASFCGLHHSVIISRRLLYAQQIKTSLVDCTLWSTHYDRNSSARFTYAVNTASTLAEPSMYT